ncbi:hypothetical protein CPB85DRAFT_1441233 [Mucidula mucida]|nr:hypothetical protein CPB85DRAFT_1441233 [Mucidula mucida]
MSESSVYRPTTPHSRHSSEDGAPHQYASRHHTSAAQDAIRLLNMDVHHWLSNAYPAAIQYEHKTYPTAVHLYQALKFVRDPDIMRIIRHAESPRKACSLSRTYASWCDPEWRRGKNVKEMERRPEAKALTTGDREIVTEGESFWGVDTTGRGQNKMGIALMHLRDCLREHSHGLPSRSHHAPGVSSVPPTHDTVYFHSKRKPYISKSQGV